MKKPFYLLFLASATLLYCYSCGNKEKHFLTNESYRMQVHEQFLERKELAKNRADALFSVFNKEDLTTEQREALEFLYAYMPLCDLADYDGDFFLQQVNSAFKAREYFSWGKSVPEDIFRHFVLAHRINNEYLDTARSVFFNELRDRVKNLPMAEAALEVNHWCHEKVTYRGTDGRTSAPLALMRTSWGRCGEESTFTATALRAVGIPARQCYTPRWAHTDDNHAWVEVWVDGAWHYMGACEPEPELDVAWFTAPAKRTMMVHTNVFGEYTGPEEKNLQTPLYSTINLLANYAQTRKVNVKVVDEQGNPVMGATIKFKLYNYAELYPLAKTLSKADGTTSITSGMGDLVIWANKGDTYGYEKASPDTDVVTVTLNRKPGKAYEETYEVVPPKEQPIKELSPDKVVQNAVRLAHEDSIRNAYMNTFPKENYAAQVATELGMDKENVWRYLELSQGNWKDILAFMQAEKVNLDLFPFLASLLEKDLRDTPADYLQNHIDNGYNNDIKVNAPKELIAANMLSPRIALELIRPWRSFFQKEFSSIGAQAAHQKVQSIIDFVKQNIQIRNEENYYNCYITPQGVYELKVADARSRNVLFVALCRSMGIAARVEQATAKPQYFENGQWVDVAFEATTIEENTPKGNLILNNPSSNIVKPGYYTHFTIARFSDGDFVSLDFENNPVLNSFPCKLSLDTGYYRLMTGSRANDGSVTIRTEYFELKKDQTLSLNVTLPEVVGKLQVKGIVDMNSIVTLTDNSKKTLKELANGKGLVLCFADPDKEPTKHVLHDIGALKTDFDSWGGGLVFMVPDDKLSPAFNTTAYKGLPQQTAWGVDAKRTLLKATAEALKIDFKNNFPLTVYLSTNGGILYSIEGYSIGVGESLLKVVRQEKTVNSR